MLIKHKIGALGSGDDIETGTYFVADALVHAGQLEGCAGFTFCSTEASGGCQEVECYFKSTQDGNDDPEWQTYVVIAGPPATAFEVGTAVRAMFHDGRWFDATVAEVGCGVYTVDWSDGDTSNRVVPGGSVHARFEVGASVRAQFHDGRWFDATVAEVGAGNYTVDWADGDESNREVPGGAVAAAPIEPVTKLVMVAIAGTDAGSGAEADFVYHAPAELPDGWLMAGHGHSAESVLIVKEGPSVQASTGWLQVWTDAGSGKEQNYTVWLPTCEDPDYCALGVVCVFGTDEAAIEPEQPAAMVHRSFCVAAELQDGVWTDAGTGASADLSLQSTGSGNLMWPGVASAMEEIPEPMKLAIEACEEGVPPA